jgi:ABC-2 type transport system permease protein
MEQGKVDVIVEIPNHLEKKLLNDNQTSLSVIINAIDGAAAGIENVYVTQVIKDFNQSIKSELVMTSFDSENKPYFNVIAIPSFWYNNTLNYKTYMVPGILVLLVTMLTLFLSGMNIVREKEIGTLEQINVTPIKKHQFIVGKLFPFWVIGLLVLTIGLLIAKIVFSIPILGNVFIIYGFAALYLMVILGIGLFISNFTETQQQSMFISWFFMVVFILMSGLFTPIESMPVWAQRITYINPIRYFVEFTRMVMLKGSGFYEVRIHFIIIVAYAILVNFLAIWSYKKVN